MAESKTVGMLLLQDEGVIADFAEEAYWRFDARRKGYSEWKGHPQSEREAFKDELKTVSQRLTAVLDEVLDELGRHHDTVDGPEGRPYPNWSMILEEKIREAISRCRV